MRGAVPTVNDVPEPLGIEKVTQAGHLVLQLPDKLVVGVLVDDSIAADLLGAVGISGERQGPEKGGSARGPVAGHCPSCGSPHLLPAEGKGLRARGSSWSLETYPAPDLLPKPTLMC